MHTRHMPDCQELLDRLQGKTIFSTLDLIQGYNQIRLLPSDVPFTGMTTPLGTYVWNVLPMGTRNASFVYQATLERILEPMIKAGKVHCFQDDLALASTSPEEHLADLQELFSILRRHKLYVNIKKLKLFQSSIKWLGFVAHSPCISCLSAQALPLRRHIKAATSTTLLRRQRPSRVGSVVFAG